MKNYADKEEAIEALATGKHFWAKSFDKFRDDPDVNIAAMTYHFQEGKRLSYNLKADEAFCCRLMRFSGEAFLYMSDEMKNNKKVALIAVTNNPSALAYASPALRADRDVVTAAVTVRGSSLSDAASHLRHDPAMLKLALKTYGWALEYATPAQRADEQIVLTAVKTHPGALRYASQELQDWIGDSSDPARFLEKAMNARDLSAKLDKTMVKQAPRLERGPKI